MAHRVFLNESLTQEDELLLVLLHELGHALEPGDHHGFRFNQCMQTLGVPRSTHMEKAAPALREWIGAVRERLGPYPVPMERQNKTLLPWDAYRRQVCWCPHCGETAYKSVSASGRPNPKSPLKHRCTESDPPAGHSTILCATLPVAEPFPDLPSSERPDYRVVPQRNPYIRLNKAIRSEAPVMRAWGAFVVTYANGKPRYSMAGLYRHRAGAANLCEHLSGINARSLDVREVALQEAEPLPGCAAGRFATVFNARTNPVIVMLNTM